MGEQVLNEFLGNLPKELFHYTGLPGLIGILQNRGGLWANDVRCMNDTGELALGERILEDALNSASDFPSFSLLARLRLHPAYLSAQVFGVCFSRNPDLLSQWRAYADDGAGFAIGFNTEKLKCLQLQVEGKPLDLGTRMSLVPMLYDEEKQQECAKRLVRETLVELHRVGRTELHDAEAQMLATVVAANFKTFALSCKSSAFREELEHRLAVGFLQDSILPYGKSPRATTPRCKFRAGRYGITPYVELRVPDGEIERTLSRFVIGPRQPTQDTEAKLRMLLANVGVIEWSSFPIENASATYR